MVRDTPGRHAAVLLAVCFCAWGCAGSSGLIDGRCPTQSEINEQLVGRRARIDLVGGFHARGRQVRVASDSTRWIRTDSVRWAVPTREVLGVELISRPRTFGPIFVAAIAASTALMFALRATPTLQLTGFIIGYLVQDARDTRPRWVYRRTNCALSSEAVP